MTIVTNNTKEPTPGAPVDRSDHSKPLHNFDNFVQYIIEKLPTSKEGNVPEADAISNVPLGDTRILRAERVKLPDALEELQGPAYELAIIETATDKLIESLMVTAVESSVRLDIDGNELYDSLSREDLEKQIQAFHDRNGLTFLEPEATTK